MHQRLIQAAAQFAACEHPDGSVGALVLFTNQDTLDPVQKEPTGAAWCSRCGSIRLDGAWKATLFRFELAVAAGAAIAAHEALASKVDEARICTTAIAEHLRAIAGAPVTQATSHALERLAQSAEEMADSFEQLARELAEPPPPLETIAMADAAAAVESATEATP